VPLCGGEWPLRFFFCLYSQVTQALDANPPFASGPALRSTEEMYPGRKAFDVGTSAEAKAQPEEDGDAARGDQGFPLAPGWHGR
jgi:hypothetical protein